MKEPAAIQSEIIDTAEELFAEHGVSKTTLWDITRKQGRTKSFIYYYFKDKTALFEEVIGREFDNMRESLMQTVENFPDNPPLRFENYLTRRMELVMEAAAYRRFVADSEEITNPAAAQAVHRARSNFDKWEDEFLRSACSTGIRLGAFPDSVSPEMFSRGISTMLNALERMFLQSRKGEQELFDSTFKTMARLLSHFNSANDKIQ